MGKLLNGMAAIGGVIGAKHLVGKTGLVKKGEDKLHEVLQDKDLEGARSIIKDVKTVSKALDGVDLTKPGTIVSLVEKGLDSGMAYAVKVRDRDKPKEVVKKESLFETMLAYIESHPSYKGPGVVRGVKQEGATLWRILNELNRERRLEKDNKNHPIHHFFNLWKITQRFIGKYDYFWECHPPYLDGFLLIGRSIETSQQTTHLYFYSTEPKNGHFEVSYIDKVSLVMLNAWIDLSNNHACLVANVIVPKGTLNLYTNQISKGFVSKDHERLKNKLQRYKECEMPQRVLFQGPPGGGKSLTVKWLIQELALIPIFVLVEDGWGIESVKTFLKDQTHKRRCALVIDDIDRFSALSHQSLLHFLEDVPNCWVFATCNNIQKLPEALRRPGRFDMTLIQPKPSPEAVAQLVEKSLKGLQPSEAVMEWLNEVAQQGSWAALQEAVKRIEVEGEDAIPDENDITFCQPPSLDTEEVYRADKKAKRVPPKRAVPLTTDQLHKKREQFDKLFEEGRLTEATALLLSREDEGA